MSSPDEELSTMAKSKKDEREKKESAEKSAKKPASTGKASAQSSKKNKAAKSAQSPARKTTTTKTSAKKPTAKKAAPKKKAATRPAARKTEAQSASKASSSKKPEKAASPPAAKAAVETPKPGADLLREPAPASIFPAGDDSRELPLEYGDTKVVLLIRDPEWVFVYWEISVQRRRELGIARNRHNKTLILRVSEISPRGETRAPYDVPVNDYTSSWYLRVKEPSSSIQVTLGLYDSQGRFQEIATSNQVKVPRLGISEEEDVEFAEIDDEIYEQIVQLSGGVRISERLGSDTFLRELHQRIYDTFHEGPLSSAGLSSGEFFGLSSGLLGGASAMFSGEWAPSSMSMQSALFSPGFEEQLQKSENGQKGNRGFWLEVGVDVIVYGATDPDAKVKFMGREIALNPDGTFRVRMVLPDSEIEFPVEAESPDGEELRKVKPVVTRVTAGNPHEPA